MFLFKNYYYPDGMFVLSFKKMRKSRFDKWVIRILGISIKAHKPIPF